jgi:hypothetical protein
MKIDIKKGVIGILLDDENTVRGVIKGRGKSKKNRKAIELCLEEEYCGVVKIQKTEDFGYSDTFTITVHIWNNDEGGPPDCRDFSLQRAIIY